MMLMRLQLQLRPTPWGEIADVVTRCFLITAAAAAAAAAAVAAAAVATTTDDDDASATACHSLLQ